MALPLIPLAATFASSLASGVASATSLAARGLATGIARGANTVGKAGANASKPTGTGVKMTSNTLDKFIKQQKTINKLSDKANNSNIRYVQRFENSMRNSSKFMNNMAKSSLVIFKNLAPFAIATSILSGGNGSGVNSRIAAKWSGLITNTSLKDKTVSQKVKEQLGVDLGMIGEKLGLLSTKAGITPGSVESNLLMQLGLSSEAIKGANNLERTRMVAKAAYYNRGNAELAELFKELTGLDIVEISTIHENIGRINEAYNKYSKLYSEEDLKRNEELAEKRAELMARFDALLENILAKFAPVIDLLIEGTTGLLNMIEGPLTKVVELIAEAILRIVHWTKLFFLRITTWDDDEYEEKKKELDKKLEEQLSIYKKDKSNKEEEIQEKQEEAKKENLYKRYGVTDDVLDKSLFSMRIDSQLFKDIPMWKDEAALLMEVVGRKRLNSIVDGIREIEKMNISDEEKTQKEADLLFKEGQEIEEMVSDLAKHNEGWNLVSEGVISKALGKAFGTDLLNDQGFNYFVDPLKTSPSREAIIKIIQDTRDVNSQPAEITSSYK